MRQIEHAPSVRAELASSEDQAGRESRHVEAPRTDHGVVEVIQIERDVIALSLARTVDERARSICTEVLEVQIAREPTLPARPLGERRMRRQEIVEERCRAAKKRQRRRGHPPELVRKELREACSSRTVERDLVASQRHGVDCEHAARIRPMPGRV